MFVFVFEDASLALVLVLVLMLVLVLVLLLAKKVNNEALDVGDVLKPVNVPNALLVPS